MSNKLNRKRLKRRKNQTLSCLRIIASVTEKAGLTGFLKPLWRRGAIVLSTGGTGTAIQLAGMSILPISRETGFPEMLDGRLKTLHPRIFGPLLAKRNNPKHMKAIRRHKMKPVEVVVVNLYPFEQTIAKPGVTVGEAIEQIDIGGPSMLRAAAKNGLIIVVDPSDYDQVQKELIEGGGTISETLRDKLVWKVFATTAAYDAAITKYLGEQLDQGNPLFPESDGNGPH